MPAFKVLNPQTLPQAVEMLKEHENLQLVAGGSDLVINLRNKLSTPGHVLNLKGIKDLHGIRQDAEGVHIGALTTLNEVAHHALIQSQYSVLAQAAGLVAGPNIRNMGTLGGNICLDTRCLWYNQSFFWRKSCNFCLKKDGNVCHVAPGGSYCWAAYSGDTAPALLTLDATLKIVGPQGTRQVPLREFFILDGIKKYHLAADEIIAEISLPTSSANYPGVYKKLRIRDSVDYPLAGVAVVGRTDAAGVCTAAQIAITAVNPAPLLVPGVSELLVGHKPTEALLAEAVDLACKTAKPMKTSLSTMPYRRHMVGVFVRKGLAEVLQLS